MTFLEQYINTVFRAGLLDFEFVDQILYDFEVTISNNQLIQFKNINDVIRTIYTTALQDVLKQYDIKVEYVIEANARASYLSVKDSDNSWNTVYSKQDLRYVIEALAEQEL